MTLREVFDELHEDGLTLVGAETRLWGRLRPRFRVRD